MKVKGQIEYMDATALVFAPATPAREPTPAEATALLDEIIKRYAAQHKTNYNGAFTSIQSKAPELVSYFQALRRTK